MTRLVSSGILIYLAGITRETEVKLMGSLRAPVFCKQKTCPSAGTLVGYNQATLAYGVREQVAAHLAQCDFCGAEMQLLAEHPSDISECVHAPMPLHLRLLAERLLRYETAPLDALFEVDLHEVSEVRV